MTPPSLFEWLGGEAPLRNTLRHFYARVVDDAVLGPVFAQMSPRHAEHVAHFIGEVLGGPTRYSAEHGGHAEMIRRHLGRALTNEQRTRWLQLLLKSADACGLPDDPEFRSALVAYLEWGSRLAVINSRLDRPPEVTEEPMPRWGWGEVKGPYLK